VKHFEEVDATAEAAATAGGEADTLECIDLGWLYNPPFEDRRHILEAVWMDMAAAPGEAEG
jgi:predicted lactoylglutathione lyase